MVVFKKSEDVKTAPVIATGLIGGWIIARETGIRPLGGIILGALGGFSCWHWFKKSGPITALSLLASYIAAFGFSHPLAKKIGAWPSVLTVTGITAGLSHLLNDKK